MGAGVNEGGKLLAVADLIRLTRQQGTLLLLWPTLWSLFIASGGSPSSKHLAVFTLGTFLMRSAGCAINDIADRNFDPHVERTRLRPLASGRLTVKEALTVFALLSLLAFALVLQLNRLTVALSFAAIALASAYPFVKRFSHLPQAVLGVAFGWGAVMAWAAVRDGVGLAAALIFIANIFWSLSYDTIYALMDREDDLKIGVKSTAILFGGNVFKAVTVFYLLFFLCLCAAGIAAGLGVWYFTGVALCLLSFIAVTESVRRNPAREAAARAFLLNALIGGLMLVFIIIDLKA